jgi:hypothetical protein
MAAVSPFTLTMRHAVGMPYGRYSTEDLGLSLAKAKLPPRTTIVSEMTLSWAGFLAFLPALTSASAQPGVVTAPG